MAAVTAAAGPRYPVRPPSLCLSRRALFVLPYPPSTLSGSAVSLPLTARVAVRRWGQQRQRVLLRLRCGLGNGGGGGGCGGCGCHSSARCASPVWPGRFSAVSRPSFAVRSPSLRAFRPPRTKAGTTGEKRRKMRGKWARYGLRCWPALAAREWPASLLAPPLLTTSAGCCAQPRTAAAAAATAAGVAAAAAAAAGAAARLRQRRWRRLLGAP